MIIKEDQQKFYCKRCIQFGIEHQCILQCHLCKQKIKNIMENQNFNPEPVEGSNDLLTDLNNEQKPKFKLNPTGVYFVVSVPSIIYSAYKLISYIFHLFI